MKRLQTSQWELQLMTLTDNNGNLAGNILETDTAMVDPLILASSRARGYWTKWEQE